MAGNMSRAAWQAAALAADPSWIFPLDAQAAKDLLAVIRQGHDADRPLLEYRRDEFDLGRAAPVIAAAFAEAIHGRGIALLRGLPREGVSEAEFELMSWVIGLHAGVARPQGKASQYISAVRDAGTVYRTTTGRGYSSNAELDYHTDSADLATLACYNKAVSGGMSIVTSSVAAHAVLAAEDADAAALLHEPFHFSRQGEQAPGEPPFYPNPIYDSEGGLLFSKWNRNRLESAQRIEGVPTLSARQRAAIDRLDEILRRPELAFTMYLQPGDMQIINNHVTLHSRTDFIDHDDPAQKRLLYRMWLAPPDGPPLPQSWAPAYGDIRPGSVRGGIVGQQQDEQRRGFEARQARDLGMSLPT